MSDLRKFALTQFRRITDELDLLKEGEEIELDENLYNVIVYELIDSNENCVKFETSEILTNLTHISRHLCEKLADLDIIHKFVNLTYGNSIPIIENILVVLGNIFTDCDIETGDYLSSNVAIVYRLKEMFLNFDLEMNVSLRNSMLYCLKSVINSTSIERFIIVFKFNFSSSILSQLWPKFLKKITPQIGKHYLMY
jgi:hypothetical protein